MQLSRSSQLSMDKLSREEIKQNLFADGYKYEAREVDNLARGNAFWNSMKDKAFCAVQQGNELVELKADRDVPEILEAVTIVRASVDEVAAFIHDFDSHYNTNATSNDPTMRERELLSDLYSDEERALGRSTISYCRIAIPGGRFRHRTTVMINSCGQRDVEGSVMYVSSSTTDARAPHSDDCVRAEHMYVYFLKRVSNETLDNSITLGPGANEKDGASTVRKTELRLFTKHDFKLDAKHAKLHLERLARPLTVRAVSQAQRYFQYLRALDELDEEDGRALGVMLVDSALSFQVRGAPVNKKQIARLSVSGIIGKSVAIHSAHVKFKFFTPLLLNVVRNLPQPPALVTKPLAELTAKDGELIGAALPFILAFNSSAESAVDEWFKVYPAIKEFERANKWFRPFIESVAKKQLRKSDWGASARLLLGALLGLSGSISRIVMAITYVRQGRIVLSRVIIGSIAATVTVQLYMVYVQHRKNANAFVREATVVLLLLKPAYDAWKVASGSEEEAHHVADPRTEMISAKLFDLFASLFPGTVIQIFAVVTAVKSPVVLDIMSIAE